MFECNASYAVKQKLLKVKESFDASLEKNDVILIMQEFSLQIEKGDAIIAHLEQELEE